jgi:YlmC/YmxH family sporulation protein
LVVRFSGLAGKEIINLRDGERLGHLGDCDLEVDPSGSLQALVMPERRGVGRGRRRVSIPWSAVQRIGPDVLIVDLAPADLPKTWRGV